MEVTISVLCPATVSGRWLYIRLSLLSACQRWVCWRCPTVPPLTPRYLTFWGSVCLLSCSEHEGVLISVIEGQAAEEHKLSASAEGVGSQKEEKYNSR